MRIIILLLLTIIVSGCTVTPAPFKHPMTEEALAKIDHAEVVVDDNHSGVAASWYRQDSSQAASSQGALAALIVGVIDAIANAAPSARATKIANKLHESMDAEQLNENLLAAFRQTVNMDVDVSNMMPITEANRLQDITNKYTTYDQLRIKTNYVLAEDGTSISVMAKAEYLSKKHPYITPYVFEKSAPKHQQSGALYSNTFTYQSDFLAPPALTEEMKQALVESVKKRYIAENGGLPAEGSKKYKNMQAEIKKASDDKLTKSEASVFMVEQWTDNSGALLLAEINKAHDFIVQHVLKDMVRVHVPSLEGTDEILEEADDGRIVRIVGKGPQSGAIISSPSNTGEFSSFGNARSISSKQKKINKTLKTKARK